MSIYVNKLPNKLHNGAGDLTSVEGSLSARQRANWDLAVLTEMSAASAMDLAAVHDTDGNLIDFEWHSADPLATLTLGHAGADLCGFRLTQLPEQPALAAVLFATYRDVWQSGQTQIVDVKCDNWSGAHLVRRSATGVAVVVTSAVAVDRLMAAQDRLLAMESGVTQWPVEPQSLADRPSPSPTGT